MLATAPVDLQESESRPIRTFLNSGFTAMSNEILDNLILKLPLAEARLLLVLCRFSTGFLRDFCFIGELKLLELTGLARSALYTAKNSLVRQDVIVIEHSKHGRCVYRLHPRFQALKPPAEAPVHVNGPLPVLSHGPMKDNKENLNLYHKHHHQPAANDDDFSFNSFSNWNKGEISVTTQDEPVMPRCSPVSTAKPEEPAEPFVLEPPAEPKPEPHKATSSLTRKLMEVGVNQFMARRLAQTHSEELIEAALERVKGGAIKNPAAYVVSELTRGGYAAPVDPLKVIAERHDKVSQRRHLERVQVEQAREASNQATVKSPLESFQELPPLEQDIILRTLQGQAEKEKFHRLSGWGPEHPVWKGLLAEIVRIRGARKTEELSVGGGLRR